MLSFIETNGPSKGPHSRRCVKGKYKVKFSVSKSIDACVRQLLLALWSSPSPLRELDQSAGIVCGTNDGLDAFQMRLQREPEQRQGQHHDGQEGDVRDREPDLRPCQEVRSQGVSGNEDFFSLATCTCTCTLLFGHASDDNASSAPPTPTSTLLPFRSSSTKLSSPSPSAVSVGTSPEQLMATGRRRMSWHGSRKLSSRGGHSMQSRSY